LGLRNSSAFRIAGKLLKALNKLSRKKFVRWWNLISWTGLMLTPCFGGSALADIRTTPHSLVRESIKADGSDLCVFCHTPSISGTPPEKAPLWQRSVQADLAFVIYDEIGRLGLGNSAVGSQSIACLSCHDTNQARGVGKSDHPFGIPYRGAYKIRGIGSPLQSGVNPATNDPGHPTRPATMLITHEEFRDVSLGTIENKTAWWVSISGNTARRTRADLPLYERHDESTGQDVPFIECSSCHDPHSSNANFLRLPPDGSRLCLTCHIK